MSNAKKILALATAAAACASLAGCGEDTKWVAEFNGEKLNAGIYLYYELSAYNKVLSYLQTNNQTVTEVTKDDVYYIEDTKQTVNAYDWIQSEAMDDLKTFCAVESEYDRLGLELTEAEYAEIEQMVAYYCDTLGFRENYEENGISEESLLTVYENNYKYSNLFFALYDGYEKIGDDGKTTEIEGELHVEDDLLWDHYDEHNVRLKIMTFNLFGENSAALTDEQKAEVETEANDYYNRAQEGESFDDLIAEYTEEDEEEKEEDKKDESSTADKEESTSESDESSTDDKEDSEEKSEEEEEDKYPNETIVNDESKSYSDAVIDQFFELEAGETALIKDTEVNNKIYVVQKFDLREREDLFEEQHDTILADVVGEDFDKYVADLVANKITLNVNQDAIDRYVPKKLVLEYE